MATAAALVFQQHEPPCAKLIFQFQDGIYGDLRSRFAERAQTTVLHDGMVALGPSFRPLPRCSNRQLDLASLALNTADSDERLPLHLAIFEGELEVVKRIVACRRNLLTVDAMACAIMCHELAIGQFLLPTLLECPRDDSGNLRYLLDLAVRVNSLPFLKYLQQQKIGRWLHFTMDFAVGNGNLEMVLFMHSVDPLNCVPFTMIDVAVDRGFTDIVKFILDTFPQVNTDKINLYDRAAAKGNLQIIKLLCEHQPNARNYSFLMAKAAALNGHVEILEWLWETYQEAGSIEWIVPVALENKSDVLNWLVERHFESDSLSDVETNIQQPIFTANIQVVQVIDALGLPLHNIYPSSLAVAQFLHSHGAQFTQKHVQLVILHTTPNRSGLLDVVKYIHENCPEVQFHPSDMDDAAAVGDLEMVRFLHEHRKEGCTTAAMNSAVYYGHFEVVKFLQQNRSEGCSGRSLRDAIALDNFEMVRYLMESYKDKDWDSLFDENGRLPSNSMSLAIFDYLIDNYNGFEDGRMLFHAIVYGEEKLLNHINQRGNLTPCDIEAALENAQRHYKPEMVKYLTALLNQKAIKSKQTDKINHQDS